MKDKNVRNSGMGFISVLTLMFVWISLILIALVFGIILVIGRLKKGKW